MVEHDFVCLSETWVEEKGWNRVKRWLSNSHIWECVYAIKERRKGRAKGGFIVRKWKGWSDDNSELIVEKGKGVIVSKVGRNVGEKGKDFLVISVFNEKNNWRNIKEVTERISEIYKKEYVIIGKDQNARIGEEIGNDTEGWNARRKSKDKKVNNEKKKLIKLIGEIGGYIVKWSSRGRRKRRIYVCGSKR